MFESGAAVTVRVILGEALYLWNKSYIKKILMQKRLVTCYYLPLIATPSKSYYEP